MDNPTPITQAEREAIYAQAWCDMVAFVGDMGFATLKRFQALVETGANIEAAAQILGEPPQTLRDEIARWRCSLNKHHRGMWPWIEWRKSRRPDQIRLDNPALDWLPMVKGLCGKRTPNRQSVVGTFGASTSIRDINK